MTESNKSLVVRRTVRATPERVFAAWTTPEQLQVWFGPRGVKCTSAQVDLRIGGAYRLENRRSDGTVVNIRGVYETIEPPRRLVFSWMIDDANSPPSRVIVELQGRGDVTEVVVRHERILDEATRASHGSGWEQCLDGLAAMLE